MRLEQENDNLAHELVTTKVELHSKLAEVCWCGFILCVKRVLSLCSRVQFHDWLIRIRSSSDIYEGLQNWKLFVRLIILFYDSATNMSFKVVTPPV